MLETVHGSGYYELSPLIMQKAADTHAGNDRVLCLEYYYRDADFARPNTESL
jgi:hypothetical protein